MNTFEFRNCRLREVLSTLAAALLLNSSGFAQLYTENFDDLNAASRWTANPGYGTYGIGNYNTLDTNFDTDGDGVIDDLSGFAFDYSTIGIPSAPNSLGGSTIGMKLQANLFSHAFGGFSVSPNGQSFSGDYTLKYDMWSNYPGPLLAGGSGSTNLSYGGIMTTGTVANFPSVADGVWFAYTGDGGSSADYRVYSPDRPAGYQTPPDPNANCGCDDDATYHAGSRNNNADLYRLNINPAPNPANPGEGSVSAPAAQLALFPNQTGFVQSGAAGMTWRQNEITKSGDLVTWKVDGTLLISLDMSGFSTPVGGGNLLFGHADVNADSSLDPNAASLLLTLIDNIRVTVDQPGDFDVDGDVDGDDFLIWQSAFQTNANGDADGDGDTDGDDFLVWQSHFGSGAASSAVPEPNSALLAMLATCAAIVCRARIQTRRASIQN